MVCYTKVANLNISFFSIGSGRPFWPVAWNTKRPGWAGMAQHYSRLGWHHLKERAVQGLKKQPVGPPCQPDIPARRVDPPCPFKFYFFYILLFTFYYMSNVYNIPLNNYITTSLKCKKVTQQLLLLFSCQVSILSLPTTI